MSRRKKNPGVGTLFGIALVVFGGWAIYDKFKSQKSTQELKKPTWPPKVQKGALYGVLSDCALAGDRYESTAENVNKAVGITLSALEEVGGAGTVDPQTNTFQLDLEEQLGAAPGKSAEANVAFAKAWATALFKRGVHPGCLKKMKIPASFGSKTNKYGADFTGWGGPWPGDTQAYLTSLVLVTSVLMSYAGYEVGLDENMQLAMLPIHEIVAGAMAA